MCIAIQIYTARKKHQKDPSSFLFSILSYILGILPDQDRQVEDGFRHIGVRLINMLFALWVSMYQWTQVIVDPQILAYISKILSQISVCSPFSMFSHVVLLFFFSFCFQYVLHIFCMFSMFEVSFLSQKWEHMWNNMGHTTAFYMFLFLPCVCICFPCVSHSYGHLLIINIITCYFYMIIHSILGFC